jgi:DNA-directed RNA polymerase specialized sigma24 family protein
MTDEARNAQTFAVVQSLPAHLRRVLVLREVEQLPMGEVARRLGLSRRAVERRWIRAIDLFMRRVERMERRGRS